MNDIKDDELAEEKRKAANRGYAKKYYLKNRESIIKRNCAYIKKRYHEDPIFREEMKERSAKHYKQNKQYNYKFDSNY